MRFLYVLSAVCLLSLSVFAVIESDYPYALGLVGGAAAWVLVFFNALK